MSVTECCGKRVRVDKTWFRPCDRSAGHTGECSSTSVGNDLQRCIETMDLIISEQRELNRKMEELIGFLKSSGNPRP